MHTKVHPSGMKQRPIQSINTPNMSLHPSLLQLAILDPHNNHPTLSLVHHYWSFTGFCFSTLNLISSCAHSLDIHND